MVVSLGSDRRGAGPGRAAPSGPGDPEWVGPYRVLGRLGAGGMGTVFLARADGGERVAVKVLRPELAGDPTFLRMFRHEVAAARRVVGFCTAQVLDAELSGELPYLVTEYVEGVRLDRAIAASGRLPATDLAGLAVGMATALTAIHGAGVVHRDLKPSNVLLSYFGPKVIDFGIARALDASAASTATGIGSGRPSGDQFSGSRATASAAAPAITASRTSRQAARRRVRGAGGPGGAGTGGRRAGAAGSAGAAGGDQLRRNSRVAAACGSGSAWSPSSSSNSVLALGRRAGSLSMHASTSSRTCPWSPSRSGASCRIR